MKTAISVPDETFAQADQCAARLGVNRSEFYTRAARLYLDQLRAVSLTSEIDEGLALAGEDVSAQVAAAAGRRHLAAVDGEW